MQSDQDSKQPIENIDQIKVETFHPDNRSGMGCLAGLLMSSVGFICSFVFLIVPVIGPILFIGGIIASLVFPFWGALAGAAASKRNYFKYNCPYCGAVLTIEAKNEINGVDCNICLKRIVVKNNQLSKIE